MATALMAEIERTTSDVVPIKERAARIAELEAEISEFGYIEEVLISAAIADGADVQRSANASPQAVLGVRLAKRETRAA